MDYAKLFSMIFVGVMIVSVLMIVAMMAIDLLNTIRGRDRSNLSDESDLSEVPEDPRDRVPRAWRSPSIKSIYGDEQEK